jgi:DNA-binding IscR family transcriptional regulator
VRGLRQGQHLRTAFRTIPLVGARVLCSVKGPRGGYALAKAPAEVTLLEVVEAVEGNLGDLGETSHERNVRLASGARP